VATAEPKFEEPPAIIIVTIYYKQTNRIISSSAENFNCLYSTYRARKKIWFLFSTWRCMHACTYEHTHNFHVLKSQAGSSL